MTFQIIAILIINMLANSVFIVPMMIGFFMTFDDPMSTYVEVMWVPYIFQFISVFVVANCVGAVHSSLQMDNENYNCKGYQEEFLLCLFFSMSALSFLTIPLGGFNQLSNAFCMSSLEGFMEGFPGAFDSFVSQHESIPDWFYDFVINWAKFTQEHSKIFIPMIALSENAVKVLIIKLYLKKNLVEGENDYITIKERFSDWCGKCSRKLKEIFRIIINSTTKVNFKRVKKNINKQILSLSIITVAMHGLVSLLISAIRFVVYSNIFAAGYDRQMHQNADRIMIIVGIVAMIVTSIIVPLIIKKSSTALDTNSDITCYIKTTALVLAIYIAIIFLLSFVFKKGIFFLDGYVGSLINYALASGIRENSILFNMFGVGPFSMMLESSLLIAIPIMLEGVATIGTMSLVLLNKIQIKRGSTK